MDKNHPDVKLGKTGVLIINLGTPDSTGWWDIRKYLKEFLSDRRVIEVNPVIWQVILNLFILTFRPSKTAKAYKEIWMKDKNMSPLLYYTKKQSERLLNSISKENIIIDYAMRYGNPSIKSRLNSPSKVSDFFIWSPNFKKIEFIAENINALLSGEERNVLPQIMFRSLKKRSNFSYEVS